MSRCSPLTYKEMPFIQSGTIALGRRSRWNPCPHPQRHLYSCHNKISMTELIWVVDLGYDHLRLEWDRAHPGIYPLRPDQPPDHFLEAQTARAGETSCS